MKLRRANKAVCLLRRVAFAHGAKRAYWLEQFSRFMRRSRITLDDLALSIAKGDGAFKKVCKGAGSSGVTSKRKGDRVTAN